MGTPICSALDFYRDETLIDSGPYNKGSGGDLVLPFLAF